MTQRQTADTKQRFSEPVVAANEGGPRVVMRHKQPVEMRLTNGS